ncbi:MAG: hypothetical protein ACI82H_000491, partial [Alphaproteobacteria bacterium]
SPMAAAMAPMLSSNLTLLMAAPFTLDGYWTDRRRL